MMTPEYLATTFDLAVSSLWRGDQADAPFLTWLDQFRTDVQQPSPSGLPHAYSVLGGGGRGIRWYASGGAILGLPGDSQEVCYRVPVEAEFAQIGDRRALDLDVPFGREEIGAGA
jgi:hypothetical protein